MTVLAAEEAAGAVSSARAARAAKKARRSSSSGRARRRIAPDMSPQEVNAELQARRREAATGTPPAAAPEGEPAGPPPASPGDGTATSSSGPSLPSFRVPVGNTGGGMVLAFITWAVVRAYLAGGSDGVKALLRAKFLNQVES